ncbi:hypothetical protein PSCICO_34960 [Pseudomonas cichorii]|uniref:DUF4123 domain-containing protein n=1 Tax=Pseudomonas cichorii TaxID=36746 RepID=UPI001910402D|nr:DUF4123 domain-containing protein [Pseudomonas cichorii]GFM88097.1 hypothetical protein PSCICO_34960 [Pseudomonas cichorii]
MFTPAHQANYMLIDGALHPNAIRHLQQRSEPLEIEPLYLGTGLATLKEQGPILVHAPVGTSLIAEWQQSAVQHLYASVFTSQAPLRTVSSHLRHFLQPPDHLGNHSLLRFADPVVMYFWLSSYRQEHLDSLLGPVTDLWIKTPIHRWQPEPESPFTHFARHGPPQAWDARFALQGEQQLAAFEQSYRWLFIEQLHEWLTENHSSAFANQTDEQVRRWMEHVLEKGRAWGLESDYAFVAWADVCHTWGLDFMDRTDGPYQRWLTLFPDKAQLPPELRVEAVAAHARSITGVPPD